ncbi:unnamed protein product [Calicophoron daubneyi]|uniref:Uncharacterized protein n=1 Tax=Calicophoron daubneyi TaxID=300641 RepID=A0AAV2TY98_CALDB
MFSDPEIEVDANDWIIRHLLRNSGITCVRFTDLTDTKDPKYSRVLRGVQSFMEAANEYLEGVEYTGNLLTTALLFMETEVRFTPEEEWKGGSGKKATENFIKRLIMGSAKVHQIRHNLFLQGANLIQHLKDNKSLLSKKNIKQQTPGNESSSENSSVAGSVKSVNEVKHVGYIRTECVQMSLASVNWRTMMRRTNGGTTVEGINFIDRHTRKMSANRHLEWLETESPSFHIKPDDE